MAGRRGSDPPHPTDPRGFEGQLAPRHQQPLQAPPHDQEERGSGRLDLRGFFAVDESVRPGFKDVTATVRIDSPAPADEIERLRASVDRHCPVLDILRRVTPVRTVVEQSSASQRPAA